MTTDKKELFSLFCFFFWKFKPADTVIYGANRLVEMRADYYGNFVESESTKEKNKSKINIRELMQPLRSEARN